MSAITVVIEYKDDAPLPTFGANMEVLGGVVTAVQFSDALAELELEVVKKAFYRQYSGT